jgi:hypothetical protein
VITILSLDPGSVNFAASILRAKVIDGKLVVNVVGTKMISTINNVLKAQEQANAFCNEIVELHNKYNFTHIVAERYQTRGIKGKTVECINLMLGILLNEFNDLDVTFLTASTWKNRYNSSLDLNDLYNDLKDAMASTKKSLRPKQVHELDCSLMGIYRLCALYNLPYFANVNTYKREQSFLNHFLESPKL